jgi:hypothetical protein
MRVTVFLVAVLYGAAWPTALLNTGVALARLGAGEPPESTLPFALLGWAIIGYVHRQRRWPPFAASHPQPTISQQKPGGPRAGG